MTTEQLAQALQRVERVLRRRPDTGISDDAPATARWSGGTRVVTHHPGGLHTVSDMPAEVGGSGDQVTPGWMFRASLASCATTTIVMAAALRGIALATLEVRVTSRSDTRGLLGMHEADGTPVTPAPLDLGLAVRIGAAGVPGDTLRALVVDALRSSPVPCVVQQGRPLGLQVDIDGA